MTGETCVLKVMNLSKKRNKNHSPQSHRGHRETARRHRRRVSVLYMYVLNTRSVEGNIGWHLFAGCVESRELFTTN